MAMVHHKSMTAVDFGHVRILANRTLEGIDSHPGFQFLISLISP
jgi:hypothetical protein